MRILIAAIILAFSVTTADAWVRGPGVGVGRPGVRGFSGIGGPGRGVGSIGRPGYGVGYPGRPTPFRPYVGRVYR